MSRTIEFTVGPTGEVVVHTRGFAGPGCREAGVFVERALGRSASEAPTAEFYLEARVDRTLNQQG
jgi:hypothetical protein